MRALNRLKWLHAFEAAARYGSFAGAAKELGVTPAAVGQLVKSLENWVGHPLFLRSRSGNERLTLINEAEEVLHYITHGLDNLETGLNKLRHQCEHPVIALTASQVLLMHWLMERINVFSDIHPNIEFRLNVTERLMNVAHGEADLGIRCGPGDWPGVQKDWLMDEEAVLVCSPYIMPQDEKVSGEWLALQKLIHDDTPHPGASFPTWDGVLLSTFGDAYATKRTLHINSTSAVILAALNGQGIAIVRKVLVQRLITTRQLVQLYPEKRWPLEWAYYIVAPENNAMRPEVKLFHDWIINQTNKISN
ncbi:LysR family transcriptional regulator [Salmonella enterica]|nr:LysR family transcriptional regulator [Salmonella enterica]